MSNDFAASFDAIARQYDAARPTYPPEVVALVCERLDPSLPHDLFEIGCGSGLATELFAREGFAITASDPSEALLAVAHQRLHLYPDVSYMLGAFEELDLAENAYAVALAAQSFHWVDAAVGVSKLFRILRPGGVVLLVWNVAHYDATPALAALRDRFLDIAPVFAGWPDSGEERFEAFVASWPTTLAAAPFADIATEIIPATYPATPRLLHQLLATFSWYQTQPLAKQQALVAALDQYIAAQDGPLTLPMRTLAVLARKPVG